jgi:hypothetical protein
MIAANEGRPQAFEDARRAIVGLPVSHVWQGHGSAIFLELGALRPTDLQDRKAGNPCGEFTLMIEWSWRIEDSTRIVCGSWSEDELWMPALDRLRGTIVVEAKLFGRLPEIAIALSSGLHLLSFATADGDPEWTLFDRRGNETTAFSIQDGSFKLERSSSS